MSRTCLLGAAAILVAGASWARADVPAPDAVVIGPIDAITADTVTVMGLVIKVPSGLADTPTRHGVPLTELTKPLAGRKGGFLGGRAMVTGSSADGVLAATRLFSDADEHLLSGDIAGTSRTNQWKIGGLSLVRSSGGVMPASAPANLFGFEVDPADIRPGARVFATGYLGDAEPPAFFYRKLLVAKLNPRHAQLHEVSIVEARCTDRSGASRDELEVEGFVHHARMAEMTRPLSPLTITYAGFDAHTPPRRVTNVVTLTPDLDPDEPRYGHYRFRASGTALDGCPLKIGVKWQGDVATSLALPDIGAAHSP
jgi:hypothetical protein